MPDIHRRSVTTFFVRPPSTASLRLLVAATNIRDGPHRPGVREGLWTPSAAPARAGARQNPLWHTQTPAKSRSIIYTVFC